MPRAIESATITINTNKVLEWKYLKWLTGEIVEGKLEYKNGKVHGSKSIAIEPASVKRAVWEVEGALAAGKLFHPEVLPTIKFVGFQNAVKDLEYDTKWGGKEDKARIDVGEMIRVSLGLP